jgi:methylphosphotriester-DNA--protein-cysteine methyltransferase
MNSAGIEAHVLARVAELTATWRPVMRDGALSLARHLRDSKSRRAIHAAGSHVMSAISRHRRAGLPSPKSFHVAFRAYAFLLLIEQGATCEQAAFWLGNSSYSSWSRLLRLRYGLSANAFRHAFTSEQWWSGVGQMIRPTVERAA